MGLDIRLPIGLLFLALGGIITLVGIFSSADIYVRSANINVNLYWGLFMLAFGLVMGFLGQHGTAAMRTAMMADEVHARQADFEHHVELQDH